MLFKKREEKKIRYKDDWFISELKLYTNTYYSRDGFNFKRSRQDSTTLEQILKLHLDSVCILAVENANGDIISLGERYKYIGFIVKNRVLTLNGRAR